MHIPSKNEDIVFRRQRRNIRSHLMTTLLFPLLVVTGLIPSIHAAVLGISRRDSPNVRKFMFVNRSGRRVDLLWMNRSTNPVSYSSNSENGEGYPYGASTGISSFIGHEFEIREMPSKKTGQCKIPENCQIGQFQVNDQEGQKITIDIDFNVLHEDDRTKALSQADALLDECDDELGDQNVDPLQLIDALSDCMEQKVNKTLAKQEDERKFQARLRQKMASELVPYACGDLNFTTSSEVINRTWSFKDVRKKNSRKYQLQVLHEQITSSIFLVPDFVTPKECDALRFFVEDETRIPFSAVKDMTKQGRLVHGLASRFYQLTQALLGWDDLEFQSQYDEFGTNLLELYKAPDGVSILQQCTKEDLDHLKQSGSDPASSKCRLPGETRVQVPTRRFDVDDASHVATVFLFCNQDESPQLGGVHFPQAAVHINPQPNLLVVAQHQSVHKAGFDGYTDEYHFCPNYDVMTHRFHFKDYVRKPTEETDRRKETVLTPEKDDKDEL